MTQEDKELLLKDLYARLSYGFVVHRYSDNRDIVIESNGIDFFAHFLEYSEGEDFKPYLRPMSSMTEEEIFEQKSRMRHEGYFVNPLYFHTIEEFDYLNSIHVDYRGLIEKGLAIEAPEGIYSN